MLTNATVKGARARARPFKMHDGDGLYVHVLPSGRKTWRMKWSVAGREKLLTFGSFPEIGLGDARELRDAAREQLARGVDPSGTRQRAIEAAAAAELERAAAQTFEQVARRWHAHQLARWSTVHAGDVLASLERDVFPAIGAMPIAAITVPVLLNALRAVETRGRIETARRIRQRVSAVFGFAMAEDLVAHNPAEVVRKALSPAPASRRQPALLEIGDARELLAAVDQLSAAPAAKLASRFLALTAVRLAPIRGMRWCEVEDLDGPAPLWRVPAARMKLKKAKKADPGADHLVPLSVQAVGVLHTARALSADYRFNESGNLREGRVSDLVFPGRFRGKPLGEGAIGELYDQAGYAGRHVPHGWRATFSTVLNEIEPENGGLIEHALAHAPKDKVKAAYDRATHLARLRDLFQRWGDLLDG